MIQLQSQEAQSDTVARLEFGGAALSSPAWSWSIYPDATVGQRTATTASNVSGLTYDVTLPGGSFFYVWVVDGASTFGPFAVEVLSDPPVVVETAEKIRSIIIANLPEIEYLVREYLPQGYNRFKVVGFKEEMDESQPPWIVITKPKYRVVPVGIGNFNDYQLEVSIAFCGSVTDDPEDRTYASSSIMEALCFILNRAHYRQLTLPSGCQIGDCFTREGRSETAQVSVTGGYRYFSVGTVVWNGKYWLTQA